METLDSLNIWKSSRRGETNKETNKRKKNQRGYGKTKRSVVIRSLKSKVLKKMRKWFNMLNSVKVSENEATDTVCPLNFARCMHIFGYHTKSSFSRIVEIEAKLERKK